MTSSSDTFPFGIADVVELLGLTVRRRLPSSLYLNCPFCGDLRGRLNVNTDKNVWRCNRCGAAGGMLALYARYNCTGNADAYEAHTPLVSDEVYDILFSDLQTLESWLGLRMKNSPTKEGNHLI